MSRNSIARPVAQLAWRTPPGPRFRLHDRGNFCLLPFALCLLFLPAVAQTLPPAPIRPKIQTACAECHDASILVQQRLSSAAWTKEVDKMIRWGALVDPRDREAFIRYFSDHFGPDKPPYTPPAPRRATPRPKR